MVQTSYTLSQALGKPGRSAPEKAISLTERRSPQYLSAQWDFLPDEGTGWQKIKVPSFWGAVEQFDHAENWKEVHTAFYASSFSCSASLGSDRVFLCLEGVSMVCDVYLNGEKIGEHGGRFTPFEIDVTETLRQGRNELCLAVGDMTHALDETKEALLYQVGLMKLGGHTPDPFMPDHQFFGGIWQPVYLERRPAFRVEKARVETSFREKKVKVHFFTEGCGSGIVRPFLTGPDGKQADVQFPSVPVTGAGEYTAEAEWPDPILWGVGQPNLCRLHLPLSGGEGEDNFSVRFGFREFWVEKDLFYLNGAPVRLFGESINMSQQMLCSNHRKDYMKLLYKTLLERINLNCIRLHSMVAPRAMVEAADETGMLIIDQSGLWSSAGRYYARGGERLVRNLQKELSEWVWRDVNSPSVIIWDAENELLRGSRDARWVLEVDRIIRAVDPTRPIEHSGSGGFEKKFAFYHIHHNEQYSYLLDQWDSQRDKPLVIGEWWVGGRAGMPRNITGRDHKLYSAFVRDIAALYRERIMELRLRGVNGIIPYNYLCYLFEPIFDYRQRVSLPGSETMQPCPDFLSPYSSCVGMGKELCNPGWDLSLPSVILNATLEKAFSNAFAPAAAFFSQRGLYVEAGTETRIIRVMNDSAVSRSFTVKWEAAVQGRQAGAGQWEITLPAGGWTNLTAEFPLSPEENDREAVLSCELWENGTLLHTDSLPLHVLAVRKPQLQPLLLYDEADGETAAMLRNLSVPFSCTDLKDLPSGQGMTLVIGAGMNDGTLSGARDRMRRFVREGGKILVLTQRFPAPWLPVKIGFQSCELQTSCDYFDIGSPAPTNRGVNFSRYFTVYTPGHPLFQGVPDTVSAFREGDGRVVDDVYVKPLASGDMELDSLRVLSGGTKQNQASALEYFDGSGCWLMLQYKLEENAVSDPMARRLLYNALEYLQGNASRRQVRPFAVWDGKTADEFLQRYGISAPGKDSLSENGVLFVGQGEDWNPSLQQKLEPWIASGGTVVLLPRKEGELEVFGNRFTVCENALLANGLYIRPSSLTWGMSGTDLEAECKRPVMDDVLHPYFPVKNALLAQNAPYASQRMTGDPYEPLVELVNRQQTCWWYFAPNHALGDAVVRVRHKRGEVLLCQLDLFAANPVSAHFARTFFLNLGIPFPVKPDPKPGLQIFRAKDRPVEMDLEKWISDMDDLNLMRNHHAEPMLLTADLACSGSPRDNMDVSGVVYLMADDTSLYAMAQVIDDKVQPGEDSLTLQMNGNSISVGLGLDGALVFTQNGAPVPGCTGSWIRTSDAEFLKNRDLASVAAGISNPYFSGYRLECAVPLSQLGLSYGCPAKLRVVLCDGDGDGRSLSMLCWPGPLEKEAMVTFEQEQREAD